MQHGAEPGTLSSALDVSNGLQLKTLGFSNKEHGDDYLKQSRPRVEYRCVDIDVPSASSRFVPRLENGLAENFVLKLKQDGIVDRWQHKRLSSHLDLPSLFPNGSAIAFASPSETLAFVQDLLRPSPGETARGGLGASVEAALAGAGELSGSGCLVRHWMRRVAVPVLRTVASVLSSTLPRRGQGERDAVMVGVHIRRGDRAIHAECRHCVNEEDPDVHAPPASDHIDLRTLSAYLRSVIESLSKIRREVGRNVVIFVASDTNEGLDMAQELLGATIANVRGRSVHSTRTTSLRMRRLSKCFVRQTLEQRRSCASHRSDRSSPTGDSTAR